MRNPGLLYPNPFWLVVVKASDVGFVEVRSNGTCQFDFFS